MRQRVHQLHAGEFSCRDLLDDLEERAPFGYSQSVRHSHIWFLVKGMSRSATTGSARIIPRQAVSCVDTAT